MAVEEVLDGFGKYTSGQLAAWSHQKVSPWYLAVNGNIDNEPGRLYTFRVYKS